MAASWAASGNALKRPTQQYPISRVKGGSSVIHNSASSTKSRKLLVADLTEFSPCVCDGVSFPTLLPAICAAHSNSPDPRCGQFYDNPRPYGETRFLEQ